jgi:hypothetical protein
MSAGHQPAAPGGLFTSLGSSRACTTSARDPARARTTLGPGFAAEGARLHWWLHFGTRLGSMLE